MAADTMDNVHAYDSASRMSEAAAEFITEYIQKQQSTNDKFAFLLSGGNTPRQLYDLLSAERYRNIVKWNSILAFFGDERMVSFDDTRNNGRMAFDHLLSKLPIPKDHIHYIRTDMIEADAVTDYEQVLHKYFGDASVSFDIALLGMGEDGHTLSLFPGSPAVNENERWVTSSLAPVEPFRRITLTAPVVKRSKCVVFMVAGKSKSRPLQHVLTGANDANHFPAQLFRDHKNVHWFCDRDAMSEIE